MTAAVAHHGWHEGGGLAQTPPKHRPGTLYNVDAGPVTLYGQPSRAVVVHSRSPAKRRPARFEHQGHAAYMTLEATVSAAEQLRALPHPSHRVAGCGAARPMGRGTTLESASREHMDVLEMH